MSSTNERLTLLEMEHRLVVDRLALIDARLEQHTRMFKELAEAIERLASMFGDMLRIAEDTNNDQKTLIEGNKVIVRHLEALRGLNG